VPGARIDTLVRRGSAQCFSFQDCAATRLQSPPDLHPSPEVRSPRCGEAVISQVSRPSLREEMGGVKISKFQNSTFSKIRFFLRISFAKLLAQFVPLVAELVDRQRTTSGIGTEAQTMPFPIRENTGLTTSVLRAIFGHPRGRFAFLHQKLTDLARRQ
jgi:hypothetical protein